MSKLTLDALKERAETVATDELLLSISGGTENSCHGGFEYQHTGNPIWDPIQAVISYFF